jgi:hypothetical protein
VTGDGGKLPQALQRDGSLRGGEPALNAQRAGVEVDGRRSTADQRGSVSDGDGVHHLNASSTKRRPCAHAL